MEIELILGEMLKLGRKPNLDELSKLLRNRGISKAQGSEEMFGWGVEKKEGEGRGHHRHRGRLGEQGGSLPDAATAIQAMVSASNLEELSIPESGLPDARMRSTGARIDLMAYHRDGTLLAGTSEEESHAELIDRHAREDENYDDFVKIFDPHHTGYPLDIDPSRTSERDPARQWEMAYDAIDALYQAGYPADTEVGITLEGQKVHELSIAEMGVAD